MEHLSVGDLVRVECPDITKVVQDNVPKVVVGRIVSLFNALDKDGDNWIIEISSACKWFLYKPKVDGGIITVLEKVKK